MRVKKEVKMEAVAVNPREVLNKVLDQLPPDDVAEVLDFTLYLKHKREAQILQNSKFMVKLVPGSHLLALSGLVEMGGDAYLDTEGIYDDE
jgi:hypothetical protein